MMMMKSAVKKSVSISDAIFTTDQKTLGRGRTDRFGNISAVSELSFHYRFIFQLPSTNAFSGLIIFLF